MSRLRSAWPKLLSGEFRASGEEEGAQAPSVIVRGEAVGAAARFIGDFGINAVKTAAAALLLRRIEKRNHVARKHFGAALVKPDADATAEHVQLDDLAGAARRRDPFADLGQTF